ncbi:hypothetical protein [Natronococcus wangiae]|uniref:hypothetical protein n=1 Tax=Natronococcus wangiae TaxID=3068275 RepID=UPI00273D90ED|nr:hypothetical protein [Natronococcus sp. AD5]
MPLQRPRVLFLLLLILGITALWTAVGTAGPETNTVRQYTAVEVSYDDELVLTNAVTGEERRATTVNVDGSIACLPSFSRDCSLARQEYQGEINASGIQSAFSYAYFDGEFYRISSNSSAEFEHEYERTEPETVFNRLAADSGRLTGTERAVLEDGETVTTGPVVHANRLVEYEGRYYTIQQTGFKAYRGPLASGSFCSSSGDDFCDRADRARLSSRLVQFGLGVLGTSGAGIGGVGLFRELRSTDRE